MDKNKRRKSSRFANSVKMKKKLAKKQPKPQTKVLTLKKTFFILLFIAFFCVLFSYLIINHLMVFAIHETRMDIKVINESIAGVNVDTDAIHFGKVQKGGESMRILTLINNDDKPHFIILKSFGNISSFISVSENNFVLQPHAFKNITVVARPPIDAKEGYYEGVLQAIFMNM
jgi:hypothetical protein